MAVDIVVGRAIVLKALAEPVRWRILELLADEDLCVCHLVDELAVAQPLVSHHLKVLKAAALVEAERYRQWTYYRLAPEPLADLAAELTGRARVARRRARRRRPCC